MDGADALLLTEMFSLFYLLASSAGGRWSLGRAHHT